VIEQLHEKGYISDPARKKQVRLVVAKGAKLSEERFDKLFAAN